MTKQSTSFFKSSFFTNILQGIVIIISVLLSFFLEQQRQVNITKVEKNLLLEDLTVTLEADLDQIQTILNNLDNSDENLKKLLDDINNNHKLLSDREVTEILLKIRLW